MKINRSWGSTKSTASEVLENAACLSKIEAPLVKGMERGFSRAPQWFQRLRKLRALEGLLITTENVVTGLHGVIDGNLHVLLAGECGFEFRADRLAD